MAFRVFFPASALAWIFLLGFTGAPHGAFGPAAATAAGWSGPYTGLFAGYGWGNAKATAPFDDVPGFFYNFGGEPYSFDADGAFAGATAGYNLQLEALVVGMEAELGYLGLRGSRLDPNGVEAGFPDTTTSFKSDFYGGIFGRLGFAVGDVLLYSKGGGGFLNARASTIDPCIAPPAGCGTETLTMRGSKTMSAWSIGGGAEWAVTPRWSVKSEYIFFDFGNVGTSGMSSEGDRYTQSIDVKVHTAKIGVNYRW